MAIRHYRALLEQGADGWGVIFPELPGCTSHGDDAEHAAAMAAEALAGHIAAMDEDGEPLPEPAAPDAPLPEWVPMEPGERLIFLLVPVELPGKALRLNISLEEGLVARIDQGAKRRGMSRSAFLAEGARRLLAEA